MARRRLLSQAQWDQLLAVPDEERQLVRHYTLNREDLDLVASKRVPHRRLGFALVLCYLRHPGRVLEQYEDVPATLLEFVARQVGAEPEDLAEYRRRDPSRRQHLAELLARTGQRPFDRTIFQEVAAWLLAQAQVNRDPAMLAQALTGELRRRRILMPSAAVLELILHQARSRAERLNHRVLTTPLGVEGCARLETLVRSMDSGDLSMLAWLRSAPQAPTARNLVAILARLQALRDLGIDRAIQARIPEAAFERLANEGLRMAVHHIKELAAGRRHAVLAATAIRTETMLLDSALGMFDRLMGVLGRRAENQTADKALRTIRDTQSQLRTLVTACRTLIDARETGTDPFVALDENVGWYTFVASVADAETLAGPDTTDSRAALLERHPTVRAFAPSLLSAVQFRGSPVVAPLLRALEVLRDMYAAGKRSLPTKAPTGFVRRSWRRFVLPGGTIDRKAYEICVFSELRDRLRAGDVWVDGSRQFRDFESCLVPRATFDALRQEKALPVAVESDPAAYFPARHRTLSARIAEVAVLAETGALTDIDLSKGELKVSPIRDLTPEAAKTLGRAAYASLPRVKITDLLQEVDAWTGFSECFTHQRSGRPPEDRAALLADGINLGLTRMAESCRGVTIRQLAWVHDWHVREETYAAALARIIDTHRTLPLAGAWGDGSTSSSDGQFFRAGGHGEAAGDVNARHGNEPGVAFYTHLSDQYGPFHTKVIAATASEAPHVLDGLLYHQTGLSIEEHYTDTGGATDHVFGLFHLLGYRFAPRLRDLKDRRLYLFPGDQAPKVLEPLMGGSLDLAHIEANWADLLRLATSIRAGTVTASALLRRLSAYPRQNGLALALRDLGRLERTLFTLDWLRDPALRRRANAGLNKGEARNALARAIFFNQLGEMRDRTFENQAYRASGLNLLVSAIILWNTRYLEIALEDQRRQGADVPLELVRHVAPLGWEHISLTGDYVWGADPVPADGLRPLRRAVSLLAA